MMKRYSVIKKCMLRSLGGEHMMIVYPDGKKAPFALQVNESFARLYGKVRDLESFSEEDLRGIIISEYGLSPEEAGAEASKILKLWEEQCMLR
ncbi:MAG: hypothetical protein K6F21_00990 [Bacteroidales bacterium]|nr:hypothetical protein [Bacteroidales bacterium]